MLGSETTMNHFFEAKNNKNDFSEDTAPSSGAGDANCFEPLLDEILIHFNKLMEVY
jgi:hypothetical protein